LQGSRFFRTGNMQQTFIMSDTSTVIFSTVRQDSSVFTPILATSITLASDTGITTAAATTYSIITTSDVGIDVTNGLSTTFATTSFVTNPAVYSSLVSAEARSSKSHTTTSSKVASPTNSTPGSSNGSSNLSTIVPAVVVPIVVILVGLGILLFILKRRHQQNSGERSVQSRFEKPELDTTELPRTHGRAELSSEGKFSVLSRFGLGSKRRFKHVVAVHELPGSDPAVAELEGD